MYLTLKQQVKHLSKKEFKNLKYLCHIAKNLKNQAIYNVRQHYFNNKKYLSYNENYKMLKDSENYKKLNSKHYDNRQSAAKTEKESSTTIPREGSIIQAIGIGSGFA